MHTEQQNHGEPGGHPGEDPRRASTGSATAEFTYTNPVESFVGTVRDLFTRPVAFFRDMARRGDFGNPLLFALVSAVISAAIGGFLGVIYATVGIGDAGVGGAIGALVSHYVLYADHLRDSVVYMRRHCALAGRPGRQAR